MVLDTLWGFSTYVNVSSSSSSQGGFYLVNKNDTSLSDAFINRLGEEFYRQEVWWGRRGFCDQPWWRNKTSRNGQRKFSCDVASIQASLTSSPKPGECERGKWASYVSPWRLELSLFSGNRSPVCLASSPSTLFKAKLNCSCICKHCLKTLISSQIKFCPPLSFLHEPNRELGTVTTHSSSGYSECLCFLFFDSIPMKSYYHYSNLQMRKLSFETLRNLPN